MCGIAGELAAAGAAPSRQLVYAMTRTLVHRGPDAEGFHFDGRVGLGHRRLSLLDLAHGGQPLFNETRSIALTCNGEIYNYLELREELLSKGHRFATGSDCEVIIHLYEQYGPDDFKRLEGMFAFALWNAEKQELILARDHFGIKPLYYTEIRENVFFASELKALCQIEDLDRSIDTVAAYDYFTSLSVPDSTCIFRAVRKVPAASYITFSARGRRRSTYWELPPVSDEFDTNEDRVVDEIRTELQRSVRISLRSDAPIGLFLSGGVDSSAIALMSCSVTKSLPSFCLGFEENTFDESRYASAVAAHLDLPHQRCLLTKHDAVHLIERICGHLDEPFGDASAVPTLMLSTLARNSVKAVLSGEGADELFGGNFWHQPHHSAAGTPDSLPYGQGTAFTSTDALRLLSNVAPELRDAVDLRRFLDLAPENSQDFPSRLDLRTYLPSDLLVKMDRIPMMVGLEVRVPFLNRQMAELALRIPWKFKVARGIGKAILKRSIEDDVPAEVVTRPKQGFSIPLDAWVWEEGPVRDLLRETLFSSRARSRGYFASSEIERMFAQHDRFQTMHGYRLWQVFMFEMWCRNFIDVRQ